MNHLMFYVQILKKYGKILLKPTDPEVLKAGI